VVRYREKRAIRMKEKYDRKMQTQAEAEVEAKQKP